jgi:hypothetical protein
MIELGCAGRINLSDRGGIDGIPTSYFFPYTDILLNFKILTSKI